MTEEIKVVAPEVEVKVVVEKAKTVTKPKVVEKTTKEKYLDLSFELNDYITNSLTQDLNAILEKIKGMQSEAYNLKKEAIATSEDAAVCSSELYNELNALLKYNAISDNKISYIKSDLEKAIVRIKRI